MCVLYNSMLLRCGVVCGVVCVWCACVRYEFVCVCLVVVGVCEGGGILHFVFRLQHCMTESPFAVRCVPSSRRCGRVLYA